MAVQCMHTFASKVYVAAPKFARQKHDTRKAELAKESAFSFFSTPPMDVTLIYRGKKELVRVEEEWTLGELQSKIQEMWSVQPGTKKPD